MTAVAIQLPWPDKRLSPNARLHWGEVAAAKRRARADAGVLALAAGAKSLKGSAGLSVAYVFHPPANWHFDDDNLEARMKAARDGIADVCGVPDSLWTVTSKVIAEPLPPHGKVIITLTPTDPEPMARAA